MDQPWYRQYFWLLVFGGIVIFAGIISLVMVCICRTQFSRRLTVRIQKSLKVKARHKQAQNSEVITNSYRSTAPPTTIIPDAGHHLYDTIPGNSTPDLCRIMYATAQKRPAPSQQLGLNSIPENSASGPCHITYATANKKPAPFQQFGLNSIPENSTQDLRRVMYATAQKRPAPSQQLGLTSKNDGKKYNLELNKSSINDRYSNASYDSVGHTTNIDYINEATEASKNGSKKYNLELNKSSINDRYSNASYDSVGHTTNLDYINEATEASENGGKKYNLELNKSSINDRYSNASYDSVGRITNIDYINEATEDYTKTLEYVEVIADDSDYDDVEI